MDLNILKQLRQERGYRLADMSEKTGYTASYLSQLERGLKQPSLEALRKISECLNVPMMTFFFTQDNVINNHNELSASENPTDTDDDLCCVIHKNQRKKLEFPGLTLGELLTPPVRKDSVGIIGMYSEMEPGRWASEKMTTHNYDETYYIIKGEMKAYIGEKIYDLGERDSLYIWKNAPHNLFNSGKETLIFIVYWPK